MKLYLSSYRVPNLEELYALLGKSASETKVALVPNAKDYYAERARAVKIRDVTEYFMDLGFRTEVVDLREYSDAARLKGVLEEYDFVWAMGGNTFILRHEMQRSGFEEAIKELLEAGKVYGGESAGALVIGNDLHGIEHADNPEFAEKIIWGGISLIDHFVLPHVGSKDFGDAIEKAREAHKHDKTLIELTDTQAFVVNGPATKIVEAA